MKIFEGYMYGVNLGGWLSQCDHTKERYDTFIVEKDIEIIKNWGMDHVRVPIDYELIQDKAGNYLEDGFGYIDKAVGWCGKYGLNMVLDVHKTYGYSFDLGYNESGFFDDPALQERFYKMWEELAKRYGKYSDRVAFELLNEVTSKEYSDRWNAISTECIKRIRKTAPVTKILLGGYYNNSIDALPDLPLPLDGNVVYNFHCYDPFPFTHQGAYWVKEMDPAFRIAYETSYGEYENIMRTMLPGFGSFIKPEGKSDGDALGREYFDNILQKAVRIAEERDVAVYCGEFGVIENATPEDAKKWYIDICACLNKYNIGHAAWSYKSMNFGIADKRMDQVREEVVRAI
jgi:aryl-phospho-beta-D-glucosidase BglC (GH1 family)